MADPEFANGGPRSSAAGASIEAPKAPRGLGVGRGFPLPTRGGVWGGGSAPSPENFFDFRSKNVDF